MTKPFRPTLMLAAVLVALPLLQAADRMHFDLVRSEPAADAHVQAPEVVTLWFTEVPQENSVSIRLVDEAGELVESTEASQDPEDGQSFHVRPAGPLSPGTYTVSWRGIGSDGHTVRGDFGFMVMAR